MRVRVCASVRAACLRAYDIVSIFWLRRRTLACSSMRAANSWRLAPRPARTTTSSECNTSLPLRAFNLDAAVEDSTRAIAQECSLHARTPARTHARHTLLQT